MSLKRTVRPRFTVGGYLRKALDDGYMKTITFIRHGESIVNAGGVTMANDVIPYPNWAKSRSRHWPSPSICN